MKDFIIIRYIKYTVIVSMLFLMPAFIFAEDAPVYDVDNMPPPFDTQSDSGVAVSPPDRDSDSSSSVMTLDQRIGRAEQQIKNMQHTSSSPKVDELQAEVQHLRGQVEELSHQLQQLQSQLKTMYSDLDKRLSEPVTKPNLPAPTKSVAKVPAKASTPASIGDQSGAANQPNVAEEQQIYQTAYDLIKEKKYNEAIATLQKMTQKYPSGQFAANAHYWLGELYGLTGKTDQSAAEFAIVINRYSDSVKVSEAHLKLAMILISKSKWPEAKSALRKIMNTYPGTASARLASEQLKQLRQAGH